MRMWCLHTDLHFFFTRTMNPSSLPRHSKGSNRKRSRRVSWLHYGFWFCFAGWTPTHLSLMFHASRLTMDGTVVTIEVVVLPIRPHRRAHHLRRTMMISCLWTCLRFRKVRCCSIGGLGSWYVSRRFRERATSDIAMPLPSQTNLCLETKAWVK